MQWMVCQTWEVSQPSHHASISFLPFWGGCFHTWETRAAITNHCDNIQPDRLILSFAPVLDIATAFSHSQLPMSFCTPLVCVSVGGGLGRLGGRVEKSAGEQRGMEIVGWGIGDCMVMRLSAWPINSGRAAGLRTGGTEGLVSITQRAPASPRTTPTGLVTFPSSCLIMKMHVVTQALISEPGCSCVSISCSGWWHYTGKPISGSVNPHLEAAGRPL